MDPGCPDRRWRTLCLLHSRRMRRLSLEAVTELTLPSGGLISHLKKKTVLDHALECSEKAVQIP